MRITTEDIKKHALEKLANSSAPSGAHENLDYAKLAAQLRHLSDNQSRDDLGLTYLSLIKEAHLRARKKLGLGDRLSLR